MLDLHYERRILLTLVYIFAMAFCVVGVFLMSTFDDQSFFDLTLKFIITALIPLVLFYKVDSFYVKYTHSNNFVQQHLEWIAHNYVLYLLVFILNNWVINTLIQELGWGYNYIFIALMLWLGYRYLKGLSSIFANKPAPKSKIIAPNLRKIFHAIRSQFNRQK